MNLKKISSIFFCEVYKIINLFFLRYLYEYPYISANSPQAMQNKEEMQDYLIFALGHCVCKNGQ